MLKICMVGATGRMGVEIIKAVEKDKELEITGAVEYKGSPKIGNDAHINAGLLSRFCLVSDTINTFKYDVIIDFSGAEGTLSNINDYINANKPIVIGSTGFTDEQFDRIKNMSQSIPVLWASNMSLGVNILVRLTELASKALGDDFDSEIFEMHHRYKKDAPSGTAITLGKAVANGRSIDFNTNTVYAREGITGERPHGAIGFQSLRGGDIAGDHTVFFCTDGERIELTHRASSRETFAKGALRAAKWLLNKPAGLYSITDVLGI